MNEGHTWATLNFAQRVLSFLERCSKRKIWPLLVFVIAIGISFFCWLPNYQLVTDFIQSPYGEAKTWWLQHPFKPVPVEQFFPLNERHLGYNAGIASHLDKMTFRAFLPLLNQVAPFGLWTLVVASHIANLIILWLSYWIVAQTTRDKVSGALTSWAVASCYAGQYGFQDHFLGDVVAVSLLVMAMFSRRSFFVTPLIFLACLTDERAVFTTPLILIFHFLRDLDFHQTEYNPPTLLKGLRRKALPFIIGILSYVLIRQSISILTGVQTGTTMLFEPDILRSHLYEDFPLRFFKVFEFLWLILFLFLAEFSSRVSTYRGLRLLLIGAFLLATFPAMIVWDLDRSLFYLLPMILISICFLPVSFSLRRLILLMTFTANLAWLYPSTSGLRKIDQFISSFIIYGKK